MKNVQKETPDASPVLQSSNLSALRKDTEFLEGKSQGIPEEKKHLMFVISDSPRVKLLLGGLLLVALILAVYLTVTRAGLNSKLAGPPPSVPELLPSPTSTQDVVITPSASGTPSAAIFPAKRFFRIERDGDLSMVVFEDSNGEIKVLREYLPPEYAPMQEIFVSPENGFIAIRSGTSMVSSLEVINLEDEATLATLTGYGRPVWLDEGKLVFNTPEILEDPRPYESGEGFSLATFSTESLAAKIIKKADAKTDYILERVDKKEIYFKKVVSKDPESWLALTETHWRINFDGNIEELID